MASSRDKKPLLPWQSADATRLRALYETRKPPGMSQLTFANTFSIGTTQGIVWQYLNGVNPLNLGAVVKFARGLRCSVGDISPTLADELNAASDHRVLQLFAKLNKDDQSQVLALMERLGPAYPQGGAVYAESAAAAAPVKRAPVTARRKPDGLAIPDRSA
jgi:hypothetical protein